MGNIEADQVDYLERPHSESDGVAHDAVNVGEGGDAFIDDA